MLSSQKEVCVAENHDKFFTKRSFSDIIKLSLSAFIVVGGAIIGFAMASNSAQAQMSSRVGIVEKDVQDLKIQYSGIDKKLDEAISNEHAILKMLSNK